MDNNKNRNDTNETQLAWYQMDADAVADKLEVDPAQGLWQRQVDERLEQYGANKLPEQKKKNAILRFLSHFNNVLIYILIAAAVTTALLSHWIDTWVILGVVMINAIVGFLQEGKAEQALESIRDMLSPQAQVVRDGNREVIAAENLVPGDIVLLSSGDKMPADLRLLEVSNLRIEESALTGESEEVGKQAEPVPEDVGIGDRLCMAYSGTTARYGTARAVVTATGAETELGKINTMMTETQEMTTPLIQRINRFGKGLSVVILSFSVLLFIFGLVFRSFDAGELFLAIIGLAVAAIPEGLPAILTITLAIGVQRMAHRNAIIRKLPSVETLGSVTVICSDKTGTLTRNEMTATSIFTSVGMYRVEGAGYEPEGAITPDGGDEERTEGPNTDVQSDPILHRLFQANFYCNNAQIRRSDDGQWELKGQPTEGALLTLAHKAGMKEQQGRRLDEIPFDSSHKFSAVLHEWEDERVVLMNGAPERLLDLCRKQMAVDGEEEMDRAFWEQKIKQGAEEGQRMLGSAYRIAPETDKLDPDQLDDGLIFIGLVGMIDPPRPEAIQAIEVCKKAGIRVKMITGDHAITARVIGRQMGIGDGKKAITGTELEKMDDEELKRVVNDNDIFARTSPQHKIRLVTALQANGEICAMTGDGVNDAPALKQAEIGVAMGIKGTEVTKDAASMVLADDNFASIANAVEEGRTIYANLRKTLLFMLPTNGAEALVVTIYIIIGTTLPITPVQILWVNMVTAVTLALALAVEPMDKGIMNQPPRDRNAPMLGGSFLFRIVYVSLMLGGMTYALFTILHDAGHNLDMVRTITLNTLVAGQLFYLFNCRSISEPALDRTFFSNRLAFITSGILIGLQLLITYVPFMNELFGTAPLRAIEWLYPLAAGLIVFITVEIEKKISRILRAGAGQRADKNPA